MFEGCRNTFFPCKNHTATLEAIKKPSEKKEQENGPPNIVSDHSESASLLQLLLLTYETHICTMTADWIRLPMSQWESDVVDVKR